MDLAQADTAQAFRRRERLRRGGAVGAAMVAAFTRGSGLLQLGEHPVGQVVREVRLPPGRDGAKKGQPGERADGDGAGDGSSLDDDPSDGVGQLGDQDDERGLVDQTGDDRAGDHPAVRPQRGEQAAQGVRAAVHQAPQRLRSAVVSVA